MFLALPLAMIFARSVEDKSGAFVGFVNFATYLASPGFANSSKNTLTFAALTTLLTVPLAFAFAYAIQRSCIPFKALWRNIALDPDPRAVAARRAVVHLPVRQPGRVQGRAGVVRPLDHLRAARAWCMAMTFSAFPHAVMILLAALSLSDARLYEAADSMATSEWRKFVTITLPGARYGLISAAMVVFTMAVSEFGVPKVIGANYSVLAIDIYKQVIGQQNFQIGAVVGLILLLPAVAAFMVDYAVRARQKSLMSARSVAYVPRPMPARDRLLLAFVLADVGGDADR